MAFSAVNRITILHNNEIINNGCTWTHNGFTESGGGTTEQLDDESPLSRLKATSVVGTPDIKADFGSIQTVTTFGMCNHNLYSQGWGRIYLWYSDDGSGWTQIGGSEYYSIPPGDRDIILFFTETGHKHYRITIGSGSAQDFFIGYLYWGNAITLDTNPTDALFVQSRIPSVRFVDTAGGGTHMVRSNPYPRGDLTMTFSRASASDYNTWHSVRNTMIGVLPPEYAPEPLIAPDGQDVFFGYVTRVDSILRSPGSVSNDTNVYDITVTMRGAV